MTPLNVLNGGGSLAADYVAMGCEDFQHFVTTWTPPEVVEDERVSLEELLAAWLYAGMGIESTAASYDHFLQVVLCILDGVLKGTVSLDYDGKETTPFPRRLVGLTSPKLIGNVLTRFGYDQLVHQTLEGRRSEELDHRLRQLTGELSRYPTPT